MPRVTKLTTILGVSFLKGRVFFVAKNEFDQVASSRPAAITEEFTPQASKKRTKSEAKGFFQTTKITGENPMGMNGFKQVDGFKDGWPFGKVTFQKLC